MSKELLECNIERPTSKLILAVVTLSGVPSPCSKPAQASRPFERASDVPIGAATCTRLPGNLDIISNILLPLPCHPARRQHSGGSWPTSCTSALVLRLRWITHGPSATKGVSRASKPASRHVLEHLRSSPARDIPECGDEELLRVETNTSERDQQIREARPWLTSTQRSQWVQVRVHPEDRKCSTRSCLALLRSAGMPVPEDRVDFVQEMQKLQAIVSAVRADIHLARSSHLEFKTKLEEYQEQPQLLDPYLEGLVGPLALLLAEAADHLHDDERFSATMHVCRLLQAMINTRGHKTIVRFFPNKPPDVERAVALLQHMQTVAVSHEVDEDAQDGSWQTRCMVLLWLSSLVLIPFDMNTIQTSKTAFNSSANGGTYSTISWLVLVGTSYLSDPGFTRCAPPSLLRCLRRRHIPALCVHPACKVSACTGARAMLMSLTFLLQRSGGGYAEQAAQQGRHARSSARRPKCILPRYVGIRRGT
jgi:hypothetical protein